MTNVSNATRIRHRHCPRRSRWPAWCLLGCALVFSSLSLAGDVLPLSQAREAVLAEHLAGGVLPTNRPPTDALLTQRFDRQPNFGYLDGDRKAWLKLSLHNDTATTRWMLRIHSEAADYIDVYQVGPGVRPNLDAPMFKGGDQRPSDVRPYRFPGYLVALEIPPGQSRDLYIAAYGRSTLPLNVSLGYESDQVQAATNGLALDVLLISIACAMLLFNLVMWRLDGERFRLSYLIYLSGIIVFTLYNTGIGYLYLWPQWPYLQQVITYFSLAAFFWGGYRFCQHFLRTEDAFPRLHRFINIVRYLGLLAIPLGLINALREAVWVVTVANLVFFSVVMYLGVAATRRGLNSAWLFLVGWSGLVLSTLVYNAYVQGLIPSNFFLQRAIIFGVAFESLLMSVAQANYLRTSMLDQQRRETAAKEAAEDALGRLDEALSNTRKANRGKDEFLRLVSHQLRTPLAHSLGMVDQLLESDLDDYQRSRCQVLSESTRLTHRQVESLLSYAELNAYRVSNRPIVRDIKPDLAELCEEGRAAGMRNGHTLLVDGLDDLPDRLTIDWPQTRQILGHLLDNALRYSHPGVVRLTLGLNASQSALVFHLSDTGPGIDTTALQANAAFEPRTQALAVPAGGLGLGIYLSRTLAAIIKADLRIENRDGVTWVELAVPVSLVVDAPSPAASTQGLAGCRILIVEDNLLNLKVLTAMLSHEGCVWQTAYDGQGGLELATRQSFDLILMDCQMPIMDGFEAARIIRGSGGPNANTPIIAVTANSMTKDREQVFAAGMNDLIPKPFSRPELVERLTHWYLGVSEPG